MNDASQRGFTCPCTWHRCVNVCMHLLFVAAQTPHARRELKQQQQRAHAFISYEPRDGGAFTPQVLRNALGDKAAVVHVAGNAILVRRHARNGPSLPKCSAMCFGMMPRLCMSRAMRCSSGVMRAVGGISGHPRRAQRYTTQRLFDPYLQNVQQGAMTHKSRRLTE